MSWYCDLCDDYHARGECPRGSFGVGKPDTGNKYEDAVSRVDHALAHLRGQRDRDYINRHLDNLAAFINEYGDELRRRYLDDPQISNRLNNSANGPGVGHSALINPETATDTESAAILLSKLREIYAPDGGRKAAGIGHNAGPPIDGGALMADQTDLV
jgi:hypothetical protein